jgi:N4-gp56 family major capsid protein
LPYTLEETLKSGDLPADLKPHLVYAEVVEGLRPPRIFQSVVTVDRQLITKQGTKLSVPVASKLTAGTVTESNLDSSGYTVSDKTMTDVDVSIGDIVYSAVRLSDVLLEDQPNIQWVRLMIRNMADAVMEKQDGDIRDTLIAGVGTTAAAATAGTLDFDDVVDALATMKSAHLYPEPAAQFALIAHPNNTKDIVKDTRFYDTKRYALGGIPFPAGEVGGLTAGCRVLETSNMIENLALVMAPPNHTKAPFAIKAIKRPLTLKSEREEVYGRQFWVTSERYGNAVIQDTGVYLISNC